VSSPNLPEEPARTDDLESAREIFQGQTTTFQAFAEILYGEFTPACALGVYRLAQDGLYLRGNPGEMYVLTKEEHGKEAALREAKNKDVDDRAALLERIRQGRLADGDKKHLREIEDFALGKSAASRILKELDMTGTPEAAQALLLKLGAWDYTVNPHVSRLGLPEKVQYPPLDGGFAAPPEENRLDLRHIAAFAIDDEESDDPDDAVSFDNGKIIVHVADPASLITPDSPLDMAARALGATLYLPDKKITMLPPEAAALFGLGLKEDSPALSFFISVNEDGSLGDCDIKLTRVKVTRMSYSGAQELMHTSPFKEIFAITSRCRAYRMKNGAVDIELPEVKIRAEGGAVSIRPLPKTDSGAMVQDAMLMAGQAAARFTRANGIPAPYASQEPPESPIESGLSGTPQTLADMFECRRKMRPGAVRSFPAPHAGLGLEAYCRATSPLRRYLDLVLHQQIRAFLLNGKLLNADEMTVRIGASEALTGLIQKAERISNLHWTLAWLLQNPGWTGRGIVVEKKGNLATVILPDIGLEAKVTIGKDVPLNAEVPLKAAGIDIARLIVNFDGE
jgi:exoribonuclease-2